MANSSPEKKASQKSVSRKNVHVRVRKVGPRELTDLRT